MSNRLNQARVIVLNDADPRVDRPRSRPKPMKFIARCVWLTGAALAGCVYLPTAGPTANEVIDQGFQEDQIRYDVVDVNRGVVDALATAVGKLSNALWEVRQPATPENRDWRCDLGLDLGSRGWRALWDVADRWGFSGFAQRDDSGTGCRVRWRCQRPIRWANPSGGSIDGRCAASNRAAFGRKGN
jgi:hypothetical protein